MSMDAGQVVAMSGMFIVGYAGVFTFIEGKTWLRIAGSCWIAFWWIPPLATLWIKGVFG